eukprot:6178667-Pleurochrysis_carterae.AAC.2
MAMAVQAPPPSPSASRSRQRSARTGPSGAPSGGCNIQPSRGPRRMRREPERNFDKDARRAAISAVQGLSSSLSEIGQAYGVPTRMLDGCFIEHAFRNWFWKESGVEHCVLSQTGGECAWRDQISDAREESASNTPAGECDVVALSGSMRCNEKGTFRFVVGLSRKDSNGKIQKG